MLILGNTNFLGGLDQLIGIIIAIFYIIFLIVSPFFLMLGLKAVKAPQQEKGKTIVTAVCNWLVLLIPVAGLIIQWFIIKSRHKIKLGQAILVWLIGVVLSIVVSLILASLFIQLVSLKVPG